MKISRFSKIARLIYPKNIPNQTSGCWLITPYRKTLCIETNTFLTAGNYKSASGELKNNSLTAGNYKSASEELKNNSVNGAMLITINRVINNVILKTFFLKNKETLTS